MGSLDDSKAVLRSLDSFQALRVGLGYLRSISVCFERDGDFQSRLSALMVTHATAPDGTFDADEANELSRSYFQMTKALLYTLLLAAIQHYLDLIETNPQLRHEELEATLDKMQACGQLETLRRLRNAVVHVKPNESIDDLVENVHKLSSKHGIVIRRVEDLLYESTEQVFRGTEIYRQPRETLEQGYEEALAYYREHIAQEDGLDQSHDGH